jgi:acylphosphatase
MTTRAVHVRVEGRVQGVGYRAFVEMNAAQLDLYGWVRNCHDGAVEAVFQGSKDAIDEMLRLCASGPPASRVDRIVKFEESGPFNTFEVRPTL